METAENKSDQLISEKTIVTRAQQGDHEAFQLLYHRYKGYVSGQCRRLGCDRELAEELTQDVFIHLWESWGTLRAGQHSEPGCTGSR
jgi:DNA-directed RNA polymerase specialized sigma24 family protein